MQDKGERRRVDSMPGLPFIDSEREEGWVLGEKTSLPEERGR